MCQYSPLTSLAWRQSPFSYKALDTDMRLFFSLPYFGFRTSVFALQRFPCPNPGPGFGQTTHACALYAWILSVPYRSPVCRYLQESVVHLLLATCIDVVFRFPLRIYACALQSFCLAKCKYQGRKYEALRSH